MNIEVIPMLEGVSNATLTAYIQDSDYDYQYDGCRPAVIICPGGAYIGITEKEAEPVALRFLSAGYNAFVLRYSIGAGLAAFPAPFIDVAKAVMLVRENAKRWGIKPDNITLCGFSAGGHVAAVFAATWQKEYLAKALKADNELFKPNALILGYPLLDLHNFKIRNLEKSPEMQPLLEMMFSAVYGTLAPSKPALDEWNCNNKITSNMPPTFLWMTAEDALVDITEGLELVKTLETNKVPYEFHIFQKGAHGFSLGELFPRKADVYTTNQDNTYKWTDLALNWLASLFRNI
jgi:acetyl esterase/lipase